MNNLKEEAKSIYLKTLSSIDLEVKLKELIKVIDEKLYLNDVCLNLGKQREVILIGFGKASLEMGRVVESLFEGRITRGLLVTNQMTYGQLQSEVIIAGHPTPNQNSLIAAKRIIKLLETAGKEALIIFLISGGGSSMVELPMDNITVAELIRFNHLLVNSGATISEINLLRKTFSKIKGGKLANRIRSNDCIAIYLSDVNNGDMKSIASGPLYKSDERPEDVRKVFEKYQLLAEIPEKLANKITKVPKRSGERIEKDERTIKNFLLLENQDAVTIAATLARHMGYRVDVNTDQVEGDYREVAKSLLTHLLKVQSCYPQHPICLISGGEVSCPVSGKGFGGRNQEFVLYSAIQLAEMGSDIEAAILSCGTDGVDGVSSATGAVVDNSTIGLARKLGVDAQVYLLQNDSHSFFMQMGGLVYTGPSGNNVRDIRVLLAKPKSI